MIQTLSGTLAAKRDQSIVIEVGGVGFKVAVAKNTFAKLPALGESVKLFTYLHVREDILALFGFLTEKELALFEQLNTISGIGPKSAIGIMGIASADQIVAAINAGKTELLTRVSGVGKKTAERVILELKGKLLLPDAGASIAEMEGDADLEDALVALGYTKPQARAAIAKIDTKTEGLSARLKEALRAIKK
ncbi:MAG: Holliday junction branch migration protein RuvA [Candidatus Harrisonbacteria bacterium]|nr:Holliday junction branch migration protein RuvA [Candidatus Harrisonbacteria bacterium]MBI2406489.1 Holliday junction branch migration protein RuvA [Candidatus Harrisonbacteria bacterium]MBI2604078.1 Holliday junction branch migration protein RuvA [Candidatus Harrisonbacteria bacterium]MBI3114436.1 Holliday junction branch migration protein RuvA [Candidatus Harrisonbacteria bacterium]